MPDNNASAAENPRTLPSIDIAETAGSWAGAIAISKRNPTWARATPAIPAIPASSTLSVIELLH